MPIAFDANAINTFQQERLEGAPNRAHEAVDEIFAGDCIALDNGKLCLQEWLDCAGGAFPFALMDWVADQIAVGKIRYFDLGNNACRKHLLQLGMPQKDHKWVRLAMGCGGNEIVTDDIDFFDPSKKKASQNIKARIKASGKGPCSRALLKDYGITVRCL